ncbi:pyridoxamine 5'-phosphate oxidase family protein [Streptomyces sp. GXMU-J5]|uniref:Pyridoxamine 5'-phosphate oxidase family protein n=2 Tax=Streptomyces beihaiensis TaxID=2984495 RepID=A0ABT3TY24_9ACTN|nr:pyridoxamine 5'-phosphate oxidase family protein [Streptomyces beihaiensis]MCX3061725.1 pyridoxamine 5'-phosphate oxidase family protein [Streptomyces beihaiensis]
MRAVPTRTAQDAATQEPRAQSARRPPGDLGRRLTARRLQLGLTRREVAVRAGMATSYLRYLEECSAAAPGSGPLIRLAEALEIPYTSLTGSAVDEPPGTGRAAREPRFTELSPAECRSLLGTHGVGRIALDVADGPVAVPVNYTVIDGDIVFRTARDATPSLAQGHPVAFEVDRVDDAFGQGWSVLVRGRASTVTDPAEQQRLAEQEFSAPWADGARDVWMRIAPREITGRRIVAEGPGDVRPPDDARTRPSQSS